MRAVREKLLHRVFGLMAIVALTMGVTVGVGGTGAPAQAQATKTVDVFVLSGQSNAARMPAEELEAELEGVLGADTATHETVVFKKAVSGTSIYVNWRPDGTADTTDDGQILKALYQEFAVFMADLVASSPGAEIRMAGLFWNQGERDARLGHGDIYQDQLNLMIADFRATMEAPEMPVFISRIKGINSYVDNDLVRAAQLAVGEEDPMAYTLDVDDIGPFDGLHWDATGYLALAERYADTYAQLRLVDWPECGPGLASVGECVRAGEPVLTCESRNGVARVAIETRHDASINIGLGVAAGASLAEIAEASVAAGASAIVSADAATTLTLDSLADGDQVLVVFGNGAPVKTVAIDVLCDMAKLGDVDCSSGVDTADVRAVLTGLVVEGGASTCETEQVHLSNCDLTLDQGCDLNDAWRLAQCIATANPNQPIECSTI